MSSRVEVIEMARKRSQQPGITPTPAALKSLVARADRLRRLVRERARRDEQAVVSQGLETRREELRETVQLAAQVAVALTLLRGAEIAANVVRSDLSHLSTRLAALRRDFADDPRSLAQPNAFDRGEYQRAFSAARETILKAWRQYVGAPDGDGLAGVLDGYEPFRPAARRLREVQQSLTTLSRTLPQQGKDIERVRTLKERAATLLQGLNVDAVVVDFLTRAQTGGFPLQELLDNKDLLKQLRLTGILACLRIVAA